MYTIRQIAEAVKQTVPIEHLTAEERAETERNKADYLNSLDKGLRNLSQRVYLPAAERRGRVDYYDRATVAAFALIIALSDFDVPRPTLEAFARWAQQPGGPLYMKIGNRYASPAEEAIRRLDKGEEFNFKIVGGPFGRKTFQASWTHNPKIEKLMSEALPSLPYPTIELPASALIHQLIDALTRKEA